MFALAIAALGCDDAKVSSTTPVRAAPSAPRASAGGPALDTAPAIDLLANRYRWHLYTPGLVIPVASEGLRKYTQDYAQPWGDVVDRDGKRGRALDAKSTTLRLPSDDARASWTDPLDDDAPLGLADLDVVVEQEAHPDQPVDAIPERRHVYVHGRHGVAERRELYEPNQVAMLLGGGGSRHRASDSCGFASNLIRHLEGNAPRARRSEGSRM